MKYFLFLLLFTTFLWNCSPKSFSFDGLWNTYPEIGKIAKDTAKYKVQILLTDLNTQKEYSYNLQPQEYFYPASTVKLPAALVALEKIHQEARFSSTDSILFQGDSIKTTIRHEIEKIFSVSDNRAFNRLLWIAGSEAINSCMALAQGQTRIQHSLQSENEAIPEHYTVFAEAGVMQFPTISPAKIPFENGMSDSYFKGDKHYRNDELVPEPMDFSQKNQYDLRALHSTLMRLFREEALEEKQRFRMADADKAFLTEAMAKYPREFGLDADKFPDNYVKFLVVGNQKSVKNSRTKIYNKVGFAYGQVTDGAYVVDEDSGKRFLLTVTIYVNENQTLNDDTYEYESIAIPFMADLGKAILQELPRP